MAVMSAFAFAECRFKEVPISRSIVLLAESKPVLFGLLIETHFQMRCTSRDVIPVRPRADSRNVTALSICENGT